VAGPPEPSGSLFQTGFQGPWRETRRTRRRRRVRNLIQNRSKDFVHIFWHFGRRGGCSFGLARNTVGICVEREHRGDSVEYFLWARVHELAVGGHFRFLSLPHRVPFLHVFLHDLVRGEGAGMDTRNQRARGSWNLRSQSSMVNLAQNPQHLFLVVDNGRQSRWNRNRSVGKNSNIDASRSLTDNGNMMRPMTHDSALLVATTQVATDGRREGCISQQGGESDEAHRCLLVVELLKVGFKVNADVRISAELA
jgi:hypothetical protein